MPNDAHILELIQAAFAEHERQDAGRHSALVAHEARMEEKLDRMNGTVASLKAEIGAGLPSPSERGDRKSLRDRMHDVEGDRAAVRLLSRTLSSRLEELAPIVNELSEARRVNEALEQTRRRTWSMFAKVAVVTFAGLGALFGLLQLLGVS